MECDDLLCRVSLKLSVLQGLSLGSPLELLFGWDQRIKESGKRNTFKVYNISSVEFSELLIKSVVLLSFTLQTIQIPWGAKIPDLGMYKHQRWEINLFPPKRNNYFFCLT